MSLSDNFNIFFPVFNSEYIVSIVVQQKLITKHSDIKKKLMPKSKEMLVQI